MKQFVRRLSGLTALAALAFLLTSSVAQEELATLAPIDPVIWQPLAESSEGDWTAISDNLRLRATSRAAGLELFFEQNPPLQIRFAGKSHVGVDGATLRLMAAIAEAPLDTFTWAPTGLKWQHRLQFPSAEASFRIGGTRIGEIEVTDSGLLVTDSGGSPIALLNEIRATDGVDRVVNVQLRVDRSPRSRNDDMHWFSVRATYEGQLYPVSLEGTWIPAPGPEEPAGGCDIDGDGQFGPQCDGPDCNDSNSSIYSGAPEIPGNSVDENCDGGDVCYQDTDNDGFATNTLINSVDLDCNDSGESPVNGNDCNDGNASVFPGATEIPGNQVDEDCNGGEICYQDNDNDGFATNTLINSVDLDCNDSGESPVNGNDCNDGNASVFPGATEIPGNQVDEDCNGGEICYQDNDNDGFATNTLINSVDLDCNDSGESPVNGNDCNDNNSSVFPGATEIPGNQVDEDCDGGEICYLDNDNDGFAINTQISSIDLDCNDPGESPVNGNDCDDNNPTIFPGATEIPGNQVDEDCDGGEICYLDNDNDGFAINTQISSIDLDCNDSGESPVNGNDCDDNNPTIFPGATEIPGNQVDEDCDGGEICYLDNDNDGFATNTQISSIDLDCNDSGESPVNGNDCNDNNPSVFPGAAEQCNNADDNCNNLVDEGFAAPTVTPSLQLDTLPQGTEISWTAVPSSTDYDIVQGDLALLASTTGDFAIASQSCFANDAPLGPLLDTSTPPPGQGYWYLARAQNCTAAGSWDSGGTSQSGGRDTEIQASGTCL